MFSEQVNYRLKEVIEENFFNAPSTNFVFLESANDGKMELNLKLNNNSLCIMNLDEKKPIPFLNQNKNHYSRRSDYAVFEIINEDTCKIHIFEMTTTVSQSKWSKKIKQQYKSAYIYCLSVATCLDIKVENIIFYTIYVNDEFEKWITKEEDNSPALLKAKLGKVRIDPKFEWDNNSIQFDFEKIFKFEHKKIQVTLSDKDYPTGEYQID